MKVEQRKKETEKVQSNVLEVQANAEEVQSNVHLNVQKTATPQFNARSGEVEPGRLSVCGVRSTAQILLCACPL